MPKKTDHETSNSMQLLEQLQISLVTPADLDFSTRARLNHDIRASLNAFALLIEELQFNFSQPPSARQQTKATQLKAHLETHRKITTLICSQLMKATGVA